MRKLPSKRKSSDEATDSPAKRQRVGPSLDSEASEVLSAVTPDSTTSSKPVEVTEERCRLFMQLLHKCCAEKNQAQSEAIFIFGVFWVWHMAKAERERRRRHKTAS